MAKMEGFILAGGQSSRMGRDKAQLRLGDSTLLRRAVVAFVPVARRVRVVGSRTGIEANGLPVVPDIYEGLGPLGGLHAALGVCETEWAAVISCDLPFATSPLFTRLASFRSREWDAVVPLQSDGRPQPLCALYAAARCLPEVEELIRAGETRPQALLRRVRTRWVEFAELEDLDGSRLFFHNVNTPSDYEEAKRRLRDVGGLDED
jgi:molybdopterin-guanine dinucleotide biosynthesis protein A